MNTKIKQPFRLQWGGHEYLVIETMGALLRFQAYTGRDILTMATDPSLADVAIYLWAAAASSEKLYPVPEGTTPISSLTPQDFADLLPPQVLLDWQQYNAQGQQTDAKKKK